jgi:peptide/nickel transport system substrate-binding protein
MKASGGRGRARALAAVSIFVLLAAACSSGGSSNKKTLSTLTVAVPQDPGILAFDAVGIGTYTFTRLIYDGLFRIRPTTRTVSSLDPGAAQSWDVSQGGKVWTFHLRKGIQFSDGSPLTAADVKYSIETIKKSKYSESIFLSEIKGVETPDPGTVVITLDRADLGFWPTMAEIIDIYPMKDVLKVGEKAFQHHPVGSGPYEVQNWTVNQSVTYVRNPHYWGPKPPFDKIVIKIVPDQSTAVDELLAGTIDATSIPVSSLSQVEGNSKLHVVSSSPPATVEFIGLRSDQPPTDDLRVRQALNYAIDRKALVNTFFKDHALIEPAVLPPFMTAHASEQPYAYDPAKAKNLLSQYGKPVSFTFEFPSSQQNNPLAQAVANYWQAVGVKVTLKPEDPGTFFAHARGGLKGGGKLGPVFLQTWSGASDPGEILANTVASSGFLSYTDLPEVDSAITAGTSSAVQATRNTEFHKADESCYRLACWTFLWYPEPLFGETKNLTALSQTEGVWDLASARVG